MRQGTFSRSAIAMAIGLLGTACTATTADDAVVATSRAADETSQLFRIGRGPREPVSVPVTSNWATPWDALGGRAAPGTSPTLIKAGSRLHAFVLAPGGAGVQWNYSDGGGPWYGWRALDGAATGNLVAAVVTPDGSYLVVVYQQSVGGPLRANLYDGDRWSGAEDIGFGNAISDPVAVYLRAPSGVPYVNVYAWDDATRTVKTASFLINAPDDPSPWTLLTGIPQQPIVGGPLSVVSSDGVSVDLFSTGYGTVVHGHQADMTQPFAWEVLPSPGARQVAALGAGSTGPGHVDVMWTDWSSQAFIKSLVNGAWQPDVALDSTVVSLPNMAPALAALGGEIMGVTAGPRYEIESVLLHEGASSPLEPITAGCQAIGSGPALVTTSPTRVDLLAVGSDQGVYHTYYDLAAPTGGGLEPPACACGGLNQPCCGGAAACGAGLACNYANACVTHP